MFMCSLCLQALLKSVSDFLQVCACILEFFIFVVLNCETCKFEVKKKKTSTTITTATYYYHFCYIEMERR